jgi:hypothetical protein
MSAANPLRLLWMHGIINSSGPRTITTEKFFEYKGLTVNSVLGLDEVVLYIGNPKKSIEYYSHEADRFASACFESLIFQVTKPEYPRSIGWLLIRGYYAAFFALHALLRVHGWACTRLSKNSIRQINQDLKVLYPGAQTLNVGLYFLKCGNGGSEVQCKKMDAQNGGSHEMLWSLLDQYINEITNTLLVDDSEDEDKKDLTSALERFQRLLNKKGGAIWFTQVRNRINYSHEYGAWFPYAQSTCDVSRIDSFLECWRDPPDHAFLTPPQDELLQFAAACAFIVSLCRTTIEDLNFRSKSNSPFRSSSGRLVELAKSASLQSGSR